MHLAPAVRFPVGRSAKAAVLACLLWGLGVAAVAAWALQTGVGAPPALAAALVCAGSGLLALRSRPAGTAGLLCWDQGAWTWQAQPGAAGAGSPVLGVSELATLFDFPDDLLLRLRTTAGVRWLWLARVHDPSAWADLRRALRAHPRAADPAVTPAVGAP